MKVDKNQLQQNKQHLQKLIHSQRNQMAAREVEIENIQNYYDKKVGNEKLNQEKRLLETQEIGQSRLLEATSQEEDKLNKIKDNLKSTQDKLTKERERITDEHKLHVENIHRNFDTKAKNILDHSREEIQDINFQVNNQIQKAKKESDSTIEQIRNKNKEQVNKANYQASLQASQSKSGQANSMRELENRYRLMMKKNEDQLKNTMAKETFKNQIEFKTRQQIFQDKNTALEKHYQELLISEKNNFERKYSQSLEQHQSILKDLKRKLKTQMSEVIAQNTISKDSIELRSNDPFYSLQTLQTSMREDDKFYYLDIPSPEHEKDNYIITAHKRKIKIIFSRSSQERIDGKAGNVQSSRRSENLTKEFKVDSILDSKGIKTAFNDGVLTYKIAKA